MAAAKLNKPHLIIHGDADPTVSVEDAHRLKEANEGSSIMILREADHVFDNGF